MDPKSQWNMPLNSQVIPHSKGPSDMQASGVPAGDPYTEGTSLITGMGAVVEASGAEPLAAGDLSTLSMNVDRELYIAGTDRIVNGIRIIDIMPVWERHLTGETIATVTNAAAATYNYYVDLEGYNHFGLQGDITDAPTSIKVFGTLQNDGTAAPSITAWEDLSSIFLGGAKTTDFVAPDSAGIFGAFKWVKIEVVAPLNADWILWGSRWFA